MSSAHRFAAPFHAARRLARHVLPAAALLTILSAGSAPSADVDRVAPAMAPAAAGAEPSASLYRPEVRLRKLHLVRPDLIPYPIAYDVYC